MPPTRSVLPERNKQSLSYKARSKIMWILEGLRIEFDGGADPNYSAVSVAVTGRYEAESPQSHRRVRAFLYFRVLLEANPWW